MSAAEGLSGVRRALEEGAREGVYTAACAWVSLKGETVLEAAVGRLSDRPEAPAADPGTVFDLASLTKPMATVTVLMGLVAEGRIDPTDPVAARLPEFAQGPDAAERRRVAVADLLAHASGLPAWRPYFEPVRARAAGDPGYMGGEAARAQVVAAAAAEPLEAPPGTRGLYSDVGFILLGEVAARTGEAPLERLFEERVAGPLGLAATGFNPGNRPDPPYLSRVAATGVCPWRGPLAGVVHDANAFAMGGVAGHAGLFGTAADVGRWAQALLAAWHGRPGPLPGAVVRRFLAPPPGGGSWTLGFNTPTPPSSAGTYFGPGAVGHLGFTGTSMWIDLDREWVVVLLTNRVHTDPEGPRIKAFRPRFHDRVGRALFGPLSPPPGAGGAPGGSAGAPAGRRRNAC
jgi:serine-type D-Ala-D-Ala carboxypeptidase